MFRVAFRSSINIIDSCKANENKLVVKDSTMNARQHAQYLKTLSGSLLFAIHDLNRRSGNQPLKMCLDFHLLAPWAFGFPASESTEFLSGPDRWFLPIAEAASEFNFPGKPFEFYITGPTIWEFLDQLEHRRKDLGYELSGFKLPTTDEEEFANWLTTNKKLAGHIMSLTSSGLQDKIRQPVAKLQGLLGSGKVRTFSDYDYNWPELQSDRSSNNFIRFFDEHKKSRIDRDQRIRKRSPKDSCFHYRVDAANESLVIAMAEEWQEPFLFITNTPLSLNHARTQINGGALHLARPIHTPLFVLSSLIEQRSNPSFDSLEILRDSLNAAQSLSKSIGSVEENAELPEYLLRKLVHFYGNIDQIERGVPSGVVDAKAVEARRMEIREAMEITGNTTRLRDRIEEARAEIVSGGQALVQKNNIAQDLSSMEHFNLEGDPIFSELQSIYVRN